MLDHLQKQYIFAHDVIAELITCGDTEISAIDLRLAINKLSEVDNDGKTGFSIQFKVTLAWVRCC